MRFATDLIYRLAASLPSPSLDGNEGEVEVPSVLSLVAQLPSASARVAGFSATLVQRDSFGVEFRRGRAASQGVVSEVVCTFGRGLWKINIGWAYLSNFTSVSDETASISSVKLRDPVAGAINVLSVLAVATVPQVFSRVYDLLFPDDGWDIMHEMHATGVGQTHEGRVTILGSRLL